MPKARGGFRSKSSEERQHDIRIDNFVAGEHTTCITLDEFPAEFVGIKTDGKAVRKLTRKLYPGVNPRSPPPDYVVVPSAGRFVVRLSRKAMQKLHFDHPRFIVIRAIDVVPMDIQDRLISLWKQMLEEGLKFGKHKKDNRSSTPALHAGVWHISSTRPIVSTDTRQEHNPAVRKLLEQFLAIVRDHIAPMIRRLLGFYCPNLLKKQERARQYMLAKVHDPLNQIDYVDFGGAFFTVAIKEGSSEVPHLDFNDHLHSLSFLIPLGREWTGGDFFSPQMKRVIPVVSGQLLGALTRLILPSGTPVTEGGRLVLTCFVDHTMMTSSERYYQQQCK